ncbi:prephenate/arogenate dehydrogenase family protein [Marinivivus vitaminiproducens]|uniref:prephenate/arogenate dehydrogenase family protein n=1 Tax=Marinivivus vitaminiproducens TaxID=3035935 RepID=UPI0027A2031B|nr:prephenate/arogenate dehydrogenase family protein [Geminicoccaceae bacterium SCSIO 64248]
MSAAAGFDRVALVGIGLINGSLARDMKRQGMAGEIVAASRRRETLDTALGLGLCDRATTDPAEAVRGADLVVIGTPVRAAGEVARAIAPGLSPEAVVTDVGSVKGAVVEAVLPELSHPGRFVAGHPVAGTEHSGPAAAIEHLFRHRWTILTPTEASDEDAIATVRGLWETVGSRVEVMTPEHHDQVLAMTSHLPHLIAFSIVGTVDDLEGHLRQEVFKFAAGGFTDFTRIAASDPTMWRDVFLSNKDAVLEGLGRFTEDLIALQRQIRWDDGDALFDLFTKTRAIRRGIVEAGQAYGRRAVIDDEPAVKDQTAP